MAPEPPQHKKSHFVTALDTPPSMIAPSCWPMVSWHLRGLTPSV